jgi:putative ABC transport system substrate-binding protein
MATRHRRAFIIAAAGWLAAPARTGAQALARTHRIAYLSSATRASHQPQMSAFEQGIRELGYIEGRNLVIDRRYADGRLERLPRLAEELVQLNPDVFFVHSTPGSLAAKAATTSTPIVFTSVADPVGVGLVSNLARPDGNITGITNIFGELTGKRLELLKQVVPAATRIALIVNPDDANAKPQIQNATAAARGLGVRLDPVVPVRGEKDLVPAFESIVRAGAQAALRLVDPLVIPLRQRTVALAAQHRLPVMFVFREDAEAGGLLSYGADLSAQYRRGAALVDKILRGARPGDIPVEQVTTFELVVNLHAARDLGLSIPHSVLVRADRIIGQ